MKKLILLPFLLLSIIGWSQTAEDYFDMAMKKSEAGNTQAAILDYDKAIDLRPVFGEAYLNRSLEKIKIEDFSGALIDVNKSLEIHDDNN